MSSDARLLIEFDPDPHEVATLAAQLPDVPWASASSTPPAQWGSVEAMLVRSARLDLTGWTVAATPALRLVQCLHTGLDNFPFERLSPSIAVAGNSGAYAPFVAERALALLLEAGHHLPTNHAAVALGQLRPALANRFLAGSRVLILGYGAIGEEVGRRVRAGGASVDAVTRDGRRPAEVDHAFAADDLRRAVASADTVVECRPLTTRTRGTIDAAVLGAMRPDACFVNVGRAGTVDEGALYEHLRHTPTFTAAIDVWWSEDYPTGRLAARFPFAGLPNFLGTPHNAALGHGAKERAFRTAVENLRRFFAGETPRGIADRTEYG